MELPIPESGSVESYAQQSAVRAVKFTPSLAYIRRPAGPPFFHEPDYVEYDLELEDEAWLRGNPRWGDRAGPSHRLPLHVLEFLVSVMERQAGGRGAAGDTERVPKAELEKVAVEALNSELGRTKYGLPDGLSPAPGEPGSAFKHMFGDLFDWWIVRRKKLGKPLLRRLWPATNPTDNNPHHTFRPHEKQWGRVRRTRRNDADAVRKLSVSPSSTRARPALSTRSPSPPLP